MICNLIDGGKLIPSFLELIDNKSHKNSPSKQSMVGAIHKSHLPMDIQMNIGDGDLKMMTFFIDVRKLGYLWIKKL